MTSLNLHSYRFSDAIVRLPSPNISQGLRAEDRGDPDPERFAQDHDAYVAALEQAGVRVHRLPPLADFPDSVFIEDVALCLPEAVILLRPGAPSRAGEAEATAAALRECFPVLHRVEDGHVDGGDILATGREILVGLSDRTDNAGIVALGEILDNMGYAMRKVETPPGVLHFKTDCALLDENTVLATPRLAQSGCFDGYEIVETAPDEEAAANAIRVNDHVIMAEGFPVTAGILESRGYHVHCVPNDEAARIDGGMSCMSLRFFAIHQ